MSTWSFSLARGWMSQSPPVEVQNARKSIAHPNVACAFVSDCYTGATPPLHGGSALPIYDPPPHGRLVAGPDGVRSTLQFLKGCMDDLMGVHIPYNVVAMTFINFRPTANSPPQPSPSPASVTIQTLKEALAAFSGAVVQSLGGDGFKPDSECDWAMLTCTRQAGGGA